MKAHVEQAAAEFVEEMAQLPDQVLQQSTFRLKRRVKGLYQVVSDLELPVASVLSLKLEFTSKSCRAQSLHHPASGKAHKEQTQQEQALQSYTQVGPSGLWDGKPGSCVVSPIHHPQGRLDGAEPVNIHVCCRLVWPS